jgi:alpha-L-rhamnosidase
VAGQIKSKGTGGAGAPDIAWQQDSFIMGNKGTDTFLPEFTFHGFRYVEVDGYPGELTAGLMEGIPLHAAVQPAGSFYCSDSLFNRIQSACRNTFLSNLFSVQSDCPHREKLGYGGDIVATSEALMANFNMSDFYAKTIRDYADESQPDGGLPETAPYTGIADEGLTRTSGPIGWGTVFPLLLYQLYQYYGNTELLTTQYPVAKKWVDFLADRSKDYLIHVDIGDHESLDPKQIEVTGTAFFYYNTTLLEKLARLLGKQEEADHYQGLAEQIKKAFLAKFYDPETGQVGIHTQANQSFALYFHMLPPDGEKKALEVLRDQILTQKNNHLATGIFGTKYLLEVLSENDLSGLACRMAGQQDFPGWGYMLANGATTLWEHWAYSDNTFSHNHPMFGSVSGWFYKYLAGFRPDTNAVAYNKIIFQPDGFERLRYVKATYHSPQGMISSSWRVSGEVFYNDIEVPVNTTATVQLPASTAGDIRESGKRLQEAGITVLSREKGWVFCRVGSGLYHFEVRRFVKESAYQGTAKK